MGNQRKPDRQRSKRLQERTAKQTAHGFRQGIDAARETMAPLMMHRYFNRGVWVGAALATFVIAAVLVGLTIDGAIVLRWPS